MKQSFFIVLILLLTVFPLSAQMKLEPISKHGPGDISVEITGNPFGLEGTAGGTPIGSPILRPGVIRMRYFLKDEIAVRIGTWVHANSAQTTPQEVQNTFFYSIRPGVEYHLGSSNEKVSTYVGAEILFDQRISSMESSVLPQIKGAQGLNGENRGYWQAGLMGVAGADYYFNSKFYFGVELGLQYAYRSNSEVVVGNEAVLFGKTTSRNFNAILSNTLRLGFIF